MVEETIRERQDNRDAINTLSFREASDQMTMGESPPEGYNEMHDVSGKGPWPRGGNAKPRQRKTYTDKKGDYHISKTKKRVAKKKRVRRRNKKSAPQEFEVESEASSEA